MLLDTKNVLLVVMVIIYVLIIAILGFGMTSTNALNVADRKIFLQVTGYIAILIAFIGTTHIIASYTWPKYCAPATGVVTDV